MITLLFAIIFFAEAQKPFTFSSQNYLGLLEGEDGSALNLQTINGIKYKSWFTGIGTGLDYYRFRSIPLFLSVNKDFQLKSVLFYLNADGGLSIPWVKDFNNGWNNPDFKMGLYAATGIGYKIHINQQKQAVLLNAGYSFKRLTAETEVIFPCFNPPCPVDIEKTKYNLNRVLVKAGFEF